ncbi:hypothetical protein HMF8227_03008 [Saliniradius amylolyticus]|uniref:Response regulatory domain-containing protein n=1 Tax=Saliniradius amylolyticus TaxID=2183582 RepID=A0A2S2E721_9ALTE|nr:SpoIIE family protein phosphatase [Saliniradius amylolyticus]AWL13456.1 hypothetical protein HMF8227_03008 [Saliniradius amylolyticus]
MPEVDLDDTLVFADDDTESESGESLQPWPVLVVDDDPEVHDLTRIVLQDLQYEQRPLQLISAHSAAEAKRCLESRSDIVLVLLDVVMESDNAGLDLVHYIRRELNNAPIRIILRTGQPGQAPERSVIVDYDINDYKEKTELTSQKLVTAVIAALRTYGYIDQVVQLNQQLEQKVAERTAQLQQANDRLSRSLSLLEEGEEAARHIQFKLLPDTPKQIQSLCFSHALRPSETMSGDFVDYFAIDDNYLGFYMADVSGHGVSSAFVTVYLKRFISDLLSHYRSDGDPCILQPQRVLEELNKALLQEDMGKHIALFYGVIEQDSLTLSYTNAGIYPWPQLNSDDCVEALAQKTPPAGLFDFAEYETQSESLPDEFHLYLFSDGILEVLPGDNLEQQQQVLQKALATHPDSPDALAEALGVKERQSLPDDLTLLMITSTGEFKGE